MRQRLSREECTVKTQSKVDTTVLLKLQVINIYFFKKGGGGNLPELNRGWECSHGVFLLLFSCEEYKVG